MKNYRTPRTLADSEFTVGYASVNRQQSSTASSVTLAIIIGFALAAAMVFGWAP